MPSTNMLKECKTRECQNRLLQLQCKKQGKEEDHVKSCRDEVEEDSATILLTKNTRHASMCNELFEWAKQKTGVQKHRE